VSTLTADRIRNHATRLGLTHLTDTLTELVDRAEAASWATSISSTCCWRKRSASAKAAGSATR
jgi:hypothetical protein